MHHHGCITTVAVDRAPVFLQAKDQRGNYLFFVNPEAGTATYKELAPQKVGQCTVLVSSHVACVLFFTFRVKLVVQLELRGGISGMKQRDEALDSYTVKRRSLSAQEVRDRREASLVSASASPRKESRIG